MCVSVRFFSSLTTRVRAFSYSRPLGLSYLLQPTGWTQVDRVSSSTHLKQFPPSYISSFFLVKTRRKDGRKEREKTLFSLGEKAKIKDDHLPIAYCPHRFLFLSLWLLFSSSYWYFAFSEERKNLFRIYFKRSLIDRRTFLVICLRLVIAMLDTPAGGIYTDSSELFFSHQWQ